MRSRPYLLLLAAIAFFVISCNKGGKSGLLVPKDAGMVVHVNSGSLSSKLSWEELSKSEWFQKMVNETHDTIALQMLKDPSSSGIDIKNDLVLYLKRQGRGGYMVFEGKLKDAAAFETFNKNINKGGDTKKDGDYNHMNLQGEGLLTWDKSNFAYVVNSPLPGGMDAFGKTGSTEAYKFPVDSLQLFGKTALSLKSSDNLDNDERFADLVKDGADVHFWLNTQFIYGNSLNMGMLSMMRFNTLIEGNIGAASFNFEDGKIKASGAQYYGEEMTRLITNYKSKNLDKEALTRIPSDNVVGVFAYNYPPEGLKEFLKMIGVDGLANGFLSRIGYSIEDFVKANKGDLMVAVYDYQAKPQPAAMSTLDSAGNPIASSNWGPDMKYIFATSINDKPAFDKLVMIASEQLKDKNPSKMSDLTYRLDKNWFVAGNTAADLDKFLTTTGVRNGFVDKLSGHPFGIYVDLQKLIRNSNDAVTDSSGKEGLAVSANFWKDVVGTGGEIKNKGITYTWEVNLVDEKTNSLKQLNNYINQLYKIDQARKEKMGWNTDAPMVDTVAVPDALK